MIAIDTNILVRYITQDHAEQSSKAQKLVESLTDRNPGYVTAITLVELTWVLESCYEADRDQIATVLTTLLRVASLRVESAETVWQALRRFTNASAEFADCLITQLALTAGCKKVFTFDKKAAKSAGMTLLT